MSLRTDDLRIRDIRELITPEDLTREFPCSEHAADVVGDARHAIHRILHGEDDRLVVVIGPCSIHDIAAAREYAALLREQRARLAGTLRWWRSSRASLRGSRLRSVYAGVSNRT